MLSASYTAPHSRLASEGNSEKPKAGVRRVWSRTSQVATRTYKNRNVLLFKGAQTIFRSLQYIQVRFISEGRFVADVKKWRCYKMWSVSIVKIYIMYTLLGTKWFFFNQTGSVFPHIRNYLSGEKVIPVWRTEVEPYEHGLCIDLFLSLQTIAVKTFQEFLKHIIHVQWKRANMKPTADDI